MKTMMIQFVIAISIAASSQAAVYGPGTGGPIPDAVINLLIPGSLSTTINVTGTGTVLSLNSVTLVLGPPNHTWCGDLEVTLIAPNGDDFHVFCRLGVPAGEPSSTGDSSNLGGTYVFTPAGASLLAAAQAAGDATLIPAATYARSTSAGPTLPGGQDLDSMSICDGDNINGLWTLRVEDWGILDTGTLTSWSFDATVDHPCPANVVNSGASANRVDVDDLLAVVTGWGSCPAPPAACSTNIVNAGTSADRTDVDDMLAVITAWGACP